MHKKKNYKIIIIFVIVVILIGVGLYLALNTDFFRTKRSAFMRYFETIPKSFEILAEGDFKTYKEKKQSTSYIRKADVKIQTSSNVADSSILDKLRMSIIQKTNPEKEQTNIDTVINNGNSELFKMSVIGDDDLYGFFSPEISVGYIGVKNEELKRIAKSSGIENVDFIPDTIREYKFDKILETTKVEKDKLKECTEMMRNHVPVSAYTKGRKRIKINTGTYSTTYYTLTLTAEQNAELQIDILSKISQDSILMDYVTSKFRLLNLDEELTNLNSLNINMKNRITKLKNNPSEAGELIITIYENKQKNVRTEIENNGNKIVIERADEEDNNFLSVKVNDSTFSLEKKDGKYILNYKDSGEEQKSVNVEYSQSGSVENNDIKNNALITIKEGIKSITYSYEDTVSFTNDIGTLTSFPKENRYILNDYRDEEIAEFVNSLKQKINEVYIGKGTSIGINLTPLFD